MVESWQHRSMRDILRVLFSRWVTALIIVAVVIGAAATATWYLPKVYEAQARLTAPLSEGEQKLTGDIRTDAALEIRQKMQLDVLTGDTVLSRVLARADDPRLQRAGSDDPRGPEEAAERISQAGVRVASADQERIKELRRNIRMEIPGGQTTGKSLSFTMYVRADSARQAKLLADLLREEFIARYHELLIDQLQARYMAARGDVDKMVTDPAGDYRKARAEWESRLGRYNSLAEAASALSLLNKGPNTDVGVARGQALALQEFVRVESELKGVSELKMNVLVAINRFRDDLTNGAAEVRLPFVPEEFTRQPAITRISETLADRYSQRAELRSKFDERNYQPLIQLAKEIAGLENELLKLFNSELAGLAAIEAKLTKQIEPLREYGGQITRSETVADLGSFVAGLQEAEARWSQQLRLYEDQQKRMTDAFVRYQEVLRSPQIVTMDAAVEPDLPIRPIVWLNLLVGVIVGVLLALTYLFLADYYDHSVRSTEEVERYLGVPVLASVGRQIRRPIHA